MKDLKKRLRQFVRERDWEQFHAPKNLAMGLAIEAAELMELFLWLETRQSYQLDAKKFANLREEIGDILLYLVNLADKFGLDPVECAIDKLALNRKKYPKDLVRGKAKKYTEYQPAGIQFPRAKR